MVARYRAGPGAGYAPRLLSIGRTGSATPHSVGTTPANPSTLAPSWRSAPRTPHPSFEAAGPPCATRAVRAHAPTGPNRRLMMTHRPGISTPWMFSDHRARPPSVRPLSDAIPIGM